MKTNLKVSSGMKVFAVFNYLFMAIVAFVCILPVVNILAISFSNSSAAAANLVKLWPVDFTAMSYKVILQRRNFMDAFSISVQRVILGTIIQGSLVVMMGYPLSKSSREFKGRAIYVGLLIFAMLFSGGLVPSYILIKNMGLLDSIWVLVLPGAVNIGNLIIMMNFMKQLPGEIEEAAFVDGSSYIQTLIRIIIPLSKPAIATITLFHFVGHWNEWFSGLIYMNTPKKYPLQTLLQTIIVSKDIRSLEDAKIFAKVSDRTIKAAQIFVTMIPVLVVYPFLQKYFTKGIVLGAVKG